MGKDDFSAEDDQEGLTTVEHAAMGEFERLIARLKRAEEDAKLKEEIKDAQESKQ